MITTKFSTVEEYFSILPSKSKRLMQEMRKTIRQEVPQAEEVISYNMPAFKLHGILVYYAAFNDHIGFFPTPSGIGKFKKEISVYKWAKGSVQFPLDQPIPFDLVRRIVKFRVEENMNTAKLKKKK